MPSATRIHHLDIVVRDLGRAAHRYRDILGVEPLKRESLPARGVDLVRFKVGETWLILVQPTSDTGPVAEFLGRHGEGFFHFALQFDDVEAAAAALAARGVGLVNETPRRGADGWKLVDIEPADSFGAMVQLVEPREG